MAHPVSVCHQWSITGMPSRPSIHRCVSGSRRSPAAKKCRREDRSWAWSSSPSGSARRIARSAVGAVKKERTPWSSMSRQNAPASGVPTGLPSYMTVVAPASSGP